MLGALGLGILSGGASLLSGLFGQSGAKKRAKEEKAAIAKANAESMAWANTIQARADAAALVPVQSFRQGGVDMDAFMAAAEEYGFNPLTFLRSGALSLFSNDFSCTTGERAMDAAIAGQGIPTFTPEIAQTQVPSTGEVLGNAFSAGMSQYISGVEQQNQNDFQKELLGMQIAGSNRNGGHVAGGSMGRSFYNPAAKLVGSDTVFGNPVATNPNVPGASSVNTDRYGDDVKDAAGWYALIGDTLQGAANSIVRNHLTINGKGFYEYLKPYLQGEHMYAKPGDPIFNKPATGGVGAGIPNY